MIHKRFWGKDMSEALRAVRNSLGADALILETTNLAAEIGGGVEVTALDEASTSDAGGTEVETDVKSAPHPMDEIRGELATLKSLLRWLAPGMNQASVVLDQLLKHGTAPEVLALIAETMKTSAGADERERLLHALRALIPTGGLIRGGGDRVALVGPSGVGKSNAIVKLTLFETQRRSCRVGWVSTDQRRLTTGDPLAVYAGILGVRYEIAGNRQELKHALDALRDCDLVLVDTAGGNPRDDKAIRDLAKLLHGFPDLRRALLMSVATNGADMADWLALYRKVGLHSLMFTKLDECRFFGPALGAALNSGLPLSYVTSGANFAGDLQIAEADVFARLMLPEAGCDD